MDRDPVIGDGHVEIVLIHVSRCEARVVLEPNGNSVGRSTQTADRVEPDNDAWRVALQTDSVRPATTRQVIDRVPRDGDGRVGGLELRSVVDMNRVCPAGQASYL